jgi:MFS family permease
MTVDLPLLLLGLALLWFPRQWMRLGLTITSRRRKSPAQRTREPWSERPPGDPRVSFAREFSKGRNYFDLLRAAVGGLAVIGGLKIPASIALADTGTRVPAWQLLALKLAIVGVGLLIQTIRYERRHLAFFAPIFYLSGLTLSLCGPWAALFAFLLIWAINPMMGGAQGFLFAYAIAAMAFGLLFRDVGRSLAIAAFGFLFLPVLLSLLARKPLVVFTRKPVHSTGAGV